MMSASGGQTQERTHFGFAEVEAGEKAGLVKALFDGVSPRYDLMNDLMSLGVHRLWKESMLDWLAPRAGQRIVDLAGGTGDIARRLVRRVEKRGRGSVHVTVCDLSPGMIGEGRQRLADKLPEGAVDWLCGDAENLPLADGCADRCTMAFGIRNVTHIGRVLGEVRRILRPGGRFVCLEFSRLALPLFDRLYDGYSFAVIPALGGLVAGDRESYQYLVESIRRFPPQQQFAAMFRAAGFDNVRFRNLSGGIAALHSGWRL